MKPARFFTNQYFFLLCVILGAASFWWWDKPAAWWVRHHLKGIHWLQYLSMPGKAIYPIVILVVLFVLFKWVVRRPLYVRHCLYLLASIIVSGVICDLLKIFFGRARPSELIHHGIYGFQWFKLHASFWSFPSGHCTTIASIVIGLGLLYPRASWLFFVLGLVVAASRVLVSAHFPSDAIAGFYLGSITAILLHSSFYRGQDEQKFAS